MISNPFNIGDIVNLRVDELYPIDYIKYNEDFSKNLIIDNERLEKLFNRKKVQIIEENKYVEFKVIHSPKITIKYHCMFIS